MKSPTKRVACAISSIFILALIALLVHSLPTRYYVLRDVSSQAEIADLAPSTPPIGIGFDLTAFYGTAVVSFPNGSTVDVAKVDASAKYQEIIKRLSLKSSQHPSPPYNSYADQVRDAPRQRRRLQNKARGLPASDDVEAIAALIRGLRIQTEIFLGRKITTAAASAPNLLALYEEDIADAFDYVDLDFQPLPYWGTLIQETAAAYAGYGFGLCQNYTDLPGCDAEQRSMPQETVMAVLYTKEALTVTLTEIQSVLWIWEPSYRFHQDYKLGQDAEHDGPRKDYYWEYVREALIRIMVVNSHYPRPGKVLLMGDCADNVHFREVLHDALGSLMEDLPEIFAHDAKFVAAKGTGELAKRGPYDPRLPENRPLNWLDTTWRDVEERTTRAVRADEERDSRDLVLQLGSPEL